MFYGCFLGEIGKLFIIESTQQERIKFLNISSLHSYVSSLPDSPALSPLLMPSSRKQRGWIWWTGWQVSLESPDGKSGLSLALDLTGAMTN